MYFSAELKEKLLQNRNLAFRLLQPKKKRGKL
nr:MAG TPA: hypothetical protein [Caudoviricetes sp.]